MIKKAKQIIRRIIPFFSLSTLFAGLIYSRKNKSVKWVSVRLIEKIYNEEREKISDKIDTILKFNETSVPFLTIEEREFPGNLENLNNGYYHTMLKRYVFAGKWFCENKKVIDSCSGLGWGTYLLSEYASAISAFDISAESINFSKETWQEMKINWEIGDALALNNFSDKSFDVAVAMETIEHFSKNDGEAYIIKLKEKLKPGGILIGSSAFPYTRKKADLLCATNPYHLHVYTLFEFRRFLKVNFSEYKIIDNWMFVARK